MRKLLLPFFFLSLPVMAETDSYKEEFCRNRLSNFDDVQKLIQRSSNQLSRTNAGGLLGQGVCWWHSRFTRNAAYIAQFRPDLPRLTEMEEIKILAKIRRGTEIVIVPGYKNLREFSLANAENIQNQLNYWQKKDGIIKQKWLNGIKGESHLDPDKLSAMMDDLYQKVSNGQIVYQMLQFPGIVAHAWLVPEMKKTSKGYLLTVLDSNFGIYEKTFTRGQTTLDYEGVYDFIPYTQFEEEEANLKIKLINYCERADLAANDDKKQEGKSNRILDFFKNLKKDKVEL